MSLVTGRIAVARTQDPCVYVVLFGAATLWAWFLDAQKHEVGRDKHGYISTSELQVCSGYLTSSFLGIAVSKWVRTTG